MTSHDSQAVVPSLWRPLGVSTFRNLLLADIASDVGTFMQSVGAAWLMVSLNAGPLYVALTQTASSLPFFIFALPAGAIGDIVDRRKLILFTEVWMAGVAIVLATVTISGLMSPILLLILTFGFSAGDAFESPTCPNWFRRKISHPLRPSTASNSILPEPLDRRWPASSSRRRVWVLHLPSMRHPFWVSSSSWPAGGGILANEQLLPRR